MVTESAQAHSLRNLFFKIENIYFYFMIIDTYMKLRKLKLRKKVVHCVKLSPKIYEIKK